MKTAPLKNPDEAVAGFDRPIRLLLVDDHALIREGIRASLLRYKRFEIVGEAADGEEALRETRSLLPDIVLMDVNLPVLSGLEATETLCREMPHLKVLVLTVHNSKEYVLRIIRSGARGYVLKDTSPDELARAIEAVYRGGAFFSPQVARFVLNDYLESTRERRPSPVEVLTRREREVLARIAEGLTNKEIAKVLSVGVRTVETHRENIMRKLSIHTVAGLTKFAIAHGIVSLELQSQLQPKAPPS